MRLLLWILFLVPVGLLMGVALVLLCLAAAVEGGGFACLAVVRLLCVELLGMDPGNARERFAALRKKGGV